MGRPKKSVKKKNKKIKKEIIQDDLDNDLFDDLDDGLTVDDNDLNDSDNDLFEEENLFNDENDFFDYGENNGETALNKHSDLLKQLTNFDPYLKIMVTEWLGLHWSETEKKYVEDDFNTPIMNIKGARWCINFLRVYARDNNIITNLDQEAYNYFIEDIIDTIYFNLGSRMEDFDIKYNGDILLIGNQLLHSAELVLLGAAGTKSFHDLLSTTTNRTESVNLQGNNQGFNGGNPYNNMGMPPQKLSFFQKINPKNWGKS